MDCLHRNRQHEGDLEQPLLQGAEKKEGASDSAAQNGHARSEISEAAGSEAEAAAAPSSRAQSVWRDPVVPATLAAVLCLWVLKLVQQGYVDGADTPLLILVCMLALKPFTTAAPPLQTSASMPVLPSGTGCNAVARKSFQSPLRPAHLKHNLPGHIHPVLLLQACQCSQGPSTAGRAHRTACCWECWA